MSICESLVADAYDPYANESIPDARSRSCSFGARKCLSDKNPRWQRIRLLSAKALPSVGEDDIHSTSTSLCNKITDGFNLFPSCVEAS